MLFGVFTPHGDGHIEVFLLLEAAIAAAATFATYRWLQGRKKPKAAKGLGLL